MSAGPGGNTSSPVDCSVCNHNGRYTQCPGCGGLLGMGTWPPCTYCRAAIGVADPPPPPPMTSTIHAAIESSEPRILPHDMQQRAKLQHELARAVAIVDGGVTPLPPLAAFAADAERMQPDEFLDLLEQITELRGDVRQLCAKLDRVVEKMLGRKA